MIDVTKALLRDRFPSLKWRHHGIGVLQAYISEHTEPEVRVHVWDPKLVRPGILESGAIHDHRFDLESTVLLGSIIETVYSTVRDNDNGAWEVFFVENARSAGEQKGFDGACHSMRARVRADRVVRMHHAGSSYTLRRGVFHRTEIDDLAITVCTLSEKRGSARLLVPYGREPVHAFGAPAPRAVQEDVLRRAYRFLGAKASDAMALEPELLTEPT